MSRFVSVLLTISIAYLLQVESKPSRIVCYYGSWATYRHGDGKFDVENIDPTLCTHFIYGFVGINEDGTVHSLDSWNDIDLKAFERFTGLKSKNKDLKIILAVGGWNEGSQKYSTVAGNPALRRKMIDTTVDLLKQYDFDGFDLDWEYPNQRGGVQEDIANYNALLKEFREEFDKHGYLLTAAVGASAATLALSYDVPEMSKYLDFINLMSYDLHGPWEHFTGINAPLYPSSQDTTPEAQQLNVDACVKAWLAAGAPKDKINVGVGFYGKSFTLADPNQHGIYAPTYGGGPPGPLTGETGTLGYHEICNYIKNENWNEEWEDEQLVPYAYKGDVWVGFDNERSLTEKVNYAIAQDLGGIMIWSVETDDFLGKCGKAYPLLTVINELLGNHVSPTAPPTTTTTTTEGHAIGDDDCKQQGFFRDTLDCAVFYYCSPNGDGTFEKWRYQCNNGLYFDPNISGCNFAELVDC